MCHRSILQNLVTQRGNHFTYTTNRYHDPKKNEIGESNVINPDGYTAVIYVSDNASVGQGSEVTINIYAPEGL
jgi:hypothetical protein